MKKIMILIISLTVILSFVSCNKENGSENGNKVVIIDNQLLNQNRKEGMFLNVPLIVEDLTVVHAYSTAKSFIASEQLVERIGDNWPDKKTTINSQGTNAIVIDKDKVGIGTENPDTKLTIQGNAGG